MSGRKIWFEPQNSYALSDIDGNYNQLCDNSEVYVMNLELKSDWHLTTVSTSFTVLYDPNNPDNLDYDFGIKANAL